MGTASKNRDLDSLHRGELEQTDRTNREEIEHSGNGEAAIITASGYYVCIFFQENVAFDTHSHNAIG